MPQPFFAARVVVVLLVILASITCSNEASAEYTVSHDPEPYTYAPTYHAALSNQDDGVSEPITLPFDFPYQDEVFKELRIHTNGFVTLGAAAPSCGACYVPQDLQPTGQPAAPDYVLSAWWADWNPASAGDIYYGPVDDKFIVEWWGVAPYGADAGQTYTFALHLYADGRFDYLYQNVEGGLASRDFGNTGSIGHQGRSAAGFAFSTSFTNGSGGKLANGTTTSYRHETSNYWLGWFNQDSSTPGPGRPEDFRTTPSAWGSKPARTRYGGAGITAVSSATRAQLPAATIHMVMTEWSTSTRTTPRSSLEARCSNGPAGGPSALVTICCLWETCSS